MINPLVLITLAYVAGIIIGNILNLPIFISFLSFGLVLSLFLWQILAKKDAKFMLIFFFILLGLINFQYRSLPPPKNDVSNLPKGQVVTLVGQVDDEPRTIEDKAFFTLKVKQANGSMATGLVSVITKDSGSQYGDEIEVKGKLEDIDGLANPGLLSFADFLERKGIHCRLLAVRSPPKVISQGRGNHFKRLSIALKNRLIIVPQKTLPEPYATLLSSIVFGSRAAKTPADIKEAYKRAGVAHLLVASGMHLGILIGVCLFLVKSSKLPLWLGVLITTAVNFLYAMMTGFGPSILRAAIMAEIVLIGLLFEREKEVYTSLALAALIILLVNPKYLFDVGFQLSFGATLSLVYLAPVIHEKLKIWLPQAVAVVVSASIAPVLVSIPITLYHFSQASLIGVITNVLLLPWIGLVVVFGFVATVLGSIYLPLGELINGANLILLWLAHRLITLLASLPFAQMFSAPPSLAMVFGYYLGLIGAVEVVRRGHWPKMNKFRSVVIVLVIVGLMLWHGAATFAVKGLTITMLDVGQGDAILIESPSGERMLIDGGERKMGQKIIVPFLRKQGINELDLVILTHPHEDHLGGLHAVLENIKVKRILEPGFNYNSQSYRRFLALVKKNRIKYSIARAGQTIGLGSDVRGNILHPSYLHQEDEANVNNWSVVMRLCYGKFSIMLTGDNEKEGEHRILEIYPEASLASTILKTGHHGSSTSTSPEFLETVSPQVAVISCGKRNKFRHPHKNTLKGLNETGIKVFRTDENGAITIRSDGQSYSMGLERSQRVQREY